MHFHPVHSIGVVKYAPICEPMPSYFDLFFPTAAGGGADGRDSHMPSLSAEDLIMAVHKASSRRVEVLSRTTGNVDQVCLYVCPACFSSKVDLLLDEALHSAWWTVSGRRVRYGREKGAEHNQREKQARLCGFSSRLDYRCVCVHVRSTARVPPRAEGDHTGGGRCNQITDRYATRSGHRHAVTQSSGPPQLRRLGYLPSSFREPLPPHYRTWTRLPPRSLLRPTRAPPCAFATSQRSIRLNTPPTRRLPPYLVCPSLLADGGVLRAAARGSGPTGEQVVCFPGRPGREHLSARGLRRRGAVQEGGLPWRFEAPEVHVYV